MEAARSHGTARAWMFVFLLVGAVPGAPLAQPARDAVSDSVGATAGEFRVDESGALSYTIPIYTVPGTAGVEPKVALVYNSNGGVGPLGKGWSIGGLSAINRCRKTREAGDFIVEGVAVDGNPKPVSYSADDAFCLDGQRLLLVAGTYGAPGSEYRLELDPFTKVTANGGDNGGPTTYTGPNHFVVRRKDGTTSWYGNTEDSRIRGTCSDTGLPQRLCGGVIGVVWAINRFEDSTGNYIDYAYQSVTGSYVAGGVQYLPTTIRYTGKRQLPGQSAPASSPYAEIAFIHGPKVAPAGQDSSRAWQGGVPFVQDQELLAVEVRDLIDQVPPRVVRHYKLSYTNSGSGSGFRLMRSVQECRENPTSVPTTACYRPTVFQWTDDAALGDSAAKFSFDTADTVTTAGETRNLVSSRIGDIDGDGRNDIAWFRAAGSGHPTCPSGNLLQVAFAERQESGSGSGYRSTLALNTVPQASYCSYLTASNGELDTAWGLLDFDGDGRDDLIVADNNGLPNAQWHVYPSRGRPASASASVFDTGNDLINVVIPTANDSDEQAQLGDFNGDGMIDFIYPTASGLRLRLLDRKTDGTGFAFSDPLAVVLPTIEDCGQPTSCNYDFFNTGGPGFGTAPDLDGDGRSDLVIRVAQNTLFNGPQARASVPQATYRTWDVVQREAIDQVQGAGPPRFFALVMRERTATAQVVAQYGGRLYAYDGTTGPTDPRQFQFADFNGDALPDLLYQTDLASDDFVYALNRGVGFQSGGPNAFTGTIQNVPGHEHLRLTDTNGDGRTELVYPSDSGAPCAGATGAQRAFRSLALSYQYSASGSFGPIGSSASTAGTCLPGGKALAEDPDQWDYFFADFDGDGATDFVRFRYDGATAKQYTSRVAAGSRFKLRDAITRITNGYGASTIVQYQPLTNKAVYRRAQGSRLDPAPDGSAAFDPDGDIDRWGRGSPVLDLISTQYVVSLAATDAPTREAPLNQSLIGYRYSGARAQAGGRGSLGFASIVTFDSAQVDGGWTATETFYRQDFPFIGRTLQTTKWIFQGSPTRGSNDLNQCSANPEQPALDCFYDPADAGDLAHLDLNQAPLSGKVVHAAASLWGCSASGSSQACAYPSNASPSACAELSASALASVQQSSMIAQTSVFGAPTALRGSLVQSQAPLFVFQPRTIDLDFDPVDSSITRHVCGLFTYGDGFGNATRTEVSTFSSGALSSKVASKVTENIYVNDAVNWRLGRLTNARVDDTRGAAVSTRLTEFDYDVDQAGSTSVSDTGLLKAERIQEDIADDQDLRTLHTLDDYGNRLYTFQCSRTKPDGTVLTDADCRTPALVDQRPVAANGPTSAVHRYVRQLFPGGRYRTEVRAPHYSPTAPRNVIEVTTERVNAADRDEFGNPITLQDANGLVTTQRFGALNRAYYVADSTGRAVTTTYRWCDTLTNGCPPATRFREKVVTAGGPDRFSWFDVHGRKTLTVTASFNAGLSGKNWAATCTAYDNHGRVVFESIPFFLSATYGTSAEPTFPSQADPCSGAVSATRTTFDVLGRVRQVEAADTSLTRTTFSGLTTTVEDSRGKKTRSTSNALGEIVTILQADPTTGALTGSTLAVTMEYDAQGNRTHVRRNAGNGEIVTETRFDFLGRPYLTVDPDRGTTNIAYNAAGEAISRTNSLQTRVEYDVDALGRVWRQKAGNVKSFGAAPDTLFRNGFEIADAFGSLLLTDTFTFDTAANGYGQLALEQRSQSDSPGIVFTRSYGYDSLGRPNSKVTAFDASSWTESTTYDAFGRVQTQRDASGETTTQFYSTRGYPSSATYSLPLVGTNGTLHEILEMDAWGHVTSERRGGLASLTTSRFHHPTRGWIDTVITGGGATQNWDFDFDTNGNLERRSRGGGAVVETLVYDRLDRLQTVTLSGSAVAPGTVNVTYDKLGNICTKSGVAYTYDGPDGCNGTSLVGRPHAVKQVGSTTYQQDALGNTVLVDSSVNNADDSALGYDAHEQVVLMARGNLTGSVPSFDAEIAYGPDRARFRRIDRQNGNAVRTTRYVGNVEIIIEGGVTRTRRYLAGGAVVTTASNLPGQVEDRWVLTDHLGSSDVVVNDAGTVVESTGFDAWGLRRNAGNATVPGTALSTTTRGFTSHEHFDAIGLIHMNGRVYDPTIARFVQSDPIDDRGIQGLNRYSYVLNNPLSLTDPTGHLSWGEWMRLGINIAVTVATGGVGGWQGFAVAGANGFMAGHLQSGTTKGGAWGAFSAITFHGIGSYFDGAEWAHQGSHVFGTNLNMGGFSAKVLAHGVTGGTVQHLQGGSFGSGFAAAGVTQALSGAIDTINPAQPIGRFQRVMVAALVGGTASTISGGKFANGAVTAAFARAFGEVASGGGDMALGSGDGAVGATGAIDTSIEASGFESRNDAARAFGDVYGPMSVDSTPQEFAAGIVKIGTGNFGYTAPLEGAVRGRTLAVGALHRALGRAYGRSYVAMAHTHWDGNQSFSSYDLHFAQVMPLYLRNTGGQTRLLDRSIINRTLQSANIRGANRIQTYLQMHSTIPGSCIHACD